MKYSRKNSVAFKYYNFISNLFNFILWKTPELCDLCFFHVQRSPFQSQCALKHHCCPLQSFSFFLFSSSFLQIGQSQQFQLKKILRISQSSQCSCTKIYFALNIILFFEDKNIGIPDPGPPKHALELRDYVKFMFSFFISLFIVFCWSLRSKK